MEIIDNFGKYEFGELEFKYIGNMYGNEVVSCEIFFYFIEYLFEGYRNNDEICILVDSMRIYIMLLMNFDGYEIFKNGGGSGR